VQRRVLVVKVRSGQIQPLAGSHCVLKPLNYTLAASPGEASHELISHSQVLTVLLLLSLLLSLFTTFVGV